jgi:sec-independent protein translocase protein TatB
VGSGEILVIMLIALVVLGPEKLPKLAADIGRWVGRARAMARQLRSQLDQEVHLEELRRLERDASDIAAQASAGITPPTSANPVITPLPPDPVIVPLPPDPPIVPLPPDPPVAALPPDPRPAAGPADHPSVAPIPRPPQPADGQH